MPLIGSGLQCVWATSVVPRPWVGHCLHGRSPTLLGCWAPTPRLVSGTSYALDDHLRQVGLVRPSTVSWNLVLAELAELAALTQGQPSGSGDPLACKPNSTLKGTSTRTHPTGRP